MSRPQAPPALPRLPSGLPQGFPTQGSWSYLEERCVRGAPDLVMEVLSPAGSSHDRETKFDVYAEAGVREYWIVDPEARAIEVHWLDGRAYRLHGRFGPEAAASSRVLEGFEVPVAEACAEA